MTSLLLGVDLGTTATKGVLCDPQGSIMAVAARPVALHADSAGFAEADTSQWWDNLCHLVPELLGLAGARGQDVAAVSTSGMVPAVVPLGERGPLRRAILQNDARAVREISDIASRMEGFDFVARTGSALSQQSVAPTLLWLARHEPDVWASSVRVVGSSDWLAQALGAEPFLEQNWALESGLFCLDGALLAPVLDAAGAPAALLAPVRRTGDIVGTVSPAAAAATGLAASTPIVVGGADHVLSAVAAGLSAPGDTLVKLGGAGDILVVADHPLPDGRLYLDAHPQPGLWLPNGCMATSGSLIRWLQQVLGGP
ncbi:MAG: hypothetical protein J2P57_24980, partial [Acidimicrobiaceae bacterium]|nr:hypothetical protein [Acidimicrobiaceae bacterium]